MEPYRVFISSIMDRSREDLIREREAARAAVNHFAPITAVWAFETEPASATPLLDHYLGAVRTSDLFVLILGERLTKPVRAEYEMACDHGKPILVFPKIVSGRVPEACQILASLNAKYDSFLNSAELLEKLRKSLGTHLLGLIRGARASTNDLGDRLAQLRRLAKAGTPVRILPTVPECPYNSFAIRNVEPAVTVLQKSNSQEIQIPSQRIEDVLESGGNEDATVMLEGRLQWATISGMWRFFPQKPPANDPLRIGLGKEVSRDVADFPHFGNPGYRFSWTNPPHIVSQEVFFDDDGCHLTSGGQILTCARYR